MEHLGIDVHKVESQICILTESGEVVERRDPDAAGAVRRCTGERPRARVLIEASTERRGWRVAWRSWATSGSGGPENFAAMYATRSRKVKPTCATRGHWPRRASWERIAPAHRNLRTDSGTCGRSSRMREAAVQTRAEPIGTGAVREIDRPDHLMVETGAVARTWTTKFNTLMFNVMKGVQLEIWEKTSVHSKGPPRVRDRSQEHHRRDLAMESELRSRAWAAGGPTPMRAILVVGGCAAFCSLVTGLMRGCRSIRTVTGGHCSVEHETRCR